MIAALYVQPTGIYSRLPDVDPWPESRDARTYAGPWAVVAHPPCERWGRWAGPAKGQDDGCFASALASVRAYGGVIEHPQASAAWPAHGLVAPPSFGWLGARWGRPGMDLLHRAGALRAPGTQSDVALLGRSRDAARADLGAVGRLDRTTAGEGSRA